MIKIYPEHFGHFFLRFRMQLEIWGLCKYYGH